MGHLSQTTIHPSVFSASINSFLLGRLVDIFCDFIPRHQRLNLNRPTESFQTRAVFRTAAQLTLESSESLTLSPQTGRAPAKQALLSQPSLYSPAPEVNVRVWWLPYLHAAVAAGRGCGGSVQAQIRSGRLQTQCLIHSARRLKQK